MLPKLDVKSIMVPLALVEFTLKSFNPCTNTLSTVILYVYFRLSIFVDLVLNFLDVVMLTGSSFPPAKRFVINTDGINTGA